MRDFLASTSIALVVLCSLASTTEAATRARTPAQTVIYDAPLRLAAGAHHTCQIKEDGTVRCWGFNVFGQLGNGTTLTPVAPVVAVGVTAAVAVAAGSFFTCALIVDSTVRCWGDNGSGQLGDGTTTARSSSAAVTGLSNAVVLTAGSQHACALMGDGTVRCWGANGSGQLGNGTLTSQPTPVTVTGLVNAVGLAAGANHTCAALADGTARCWGANGSGQLGDGSTVTRTTPVAVVALSNVAGITARNVHTCALLANGTVRCWGSNSAGQLGTGTSISQALTPVTVNGLANAVNVSAGNLHTCAVLASGVTGCWGNNGSGQLGDGTAILRSKPVAVTGISTAVAVAAGTDHSCAVVADGSARCWGSNLFAQLGNGTTASGVITPSPSTVAGGGGSIMVRAIAAGFSHNCVVRASGAVSCWGYNIWGQVGDGGSTSRLTPFTTSVANAVAVAAGDLHSCALTVGGGARCWGINDSGQLGDGTTITRRTPVTVAGLTNAVALAGGLRHTCALLADGSVRCWGSNGDGRLGDGTIVRRLTPVKVIGVANAVAIAAGSFHTCALLAGGSVRCWGNNASAQLGDGTTIDSLTPTTVSGLTNAVAIAGGTNHTCAVLADGSARCWGNNGFGAVGDGTGIDRLAPVLVSGLSNAVAIAGNSGSGTQDPSCALVANGQARCWGRNEYGQIGDGTTTTRLSPTTVTLRSNFFITTLGGTVRIATGNSHTCSSQANGGLLCWGNNESGQLGDGTTTARLRPASASVRTLNSVPSITFNINPRVTLEEDVREVTVNVLAACDAGQELQLEVALTQGAVSGHGSGVHTCVGGLSSYPVTVSASGGTAFLAGPATVEADAVIVEDGAVVDTQHWGRAVDVLGTDGSLEGSASGIGTGKDDASVRLTGQFTAEAAISLDQARLTVSALLLEAGGAGELVRGAGGAVLLPLTLVARAGSTPTAAIYETASGVQPVVRVEVKNRESGVDVLEYLVTVSRATAPVGPALCSGGATATTSLRTRLRLDAGGDEAVDLDVTVPWRCLGRQLRSP
jgi:alpha-tubulin suppressor-like RCC1 family protein